MMLFAFKRISLALLLLIFVSAASFALIFTAGDPATSIVGQGGSAEDAAKARVQLGLDRPVYEQYLSWAAKTARGDLGLSLRFNQPVATMIVESFKTTTKIASLAAGIAFSVALLLGGLAGRYKDSALDKAVMLVSVTAQSIPSFCLALFGILMLSVYYPILPSSGTGTWKHLVLPVGVLAFYAMPAVLKLTRSGMVNAMAQDYTRTSRAMGLGEGQIAWKYGLRNAVLPVLVVAAAQFGSLLSGTIIVESIFAVYGAGRLALDSVLGGDIPVLQGLILCFSMIYVVLTLLADLGVAWLDPRLRG